MVPMRLLYKGEEVNYKLLDICSTLEPLGDTTQVLLQLQ